MQILTNLDFNNTSTIVNLPNATAAQSPVTLTQLSAANAAITTANVYNQTYTTLAISTAINNLINAAPGTLDTLGEIAANLAQEGSAITAITNSLTSTNSNVAAANVSIATLSSSINAINTTAIRKYSVNIGDGTTSSIVVTHNLNSRNLEYSVARNSAPYDNVWVDVQMTTANSATIVFAAAPAASAFTATFIG